MFTDMVDYTALTQRNERLAVELLSEHNVLLRSIFPKFGGREVKAIGDSFLVEFPSALEAVRCAVTIQEHLRERNQDLLTERSIQLRVGIHIGDVIDGGGDIFGDAVNISSRIEPLAEPGGICISEQVYAQVRNKLELRLVKLAVAHLKGVSVPVDVYRIVMPWAMGESKESVEPDRTRIAVLPFASISPDPQDEYFADGMTEELIKTTSSIAGLTLIARTSVMGYKGTTKKVEEIGNELSVGTVLEGSVRKAGNRLRITVQLIDVKSQGHLWAKSYDKELDDVFALQTEIARSIADSLKVEIHPSEERLIERTPTRDLEAYELYLKGRYQWNKRTKEAIHMAIDCFQQAVGKDPGFALAYSGMADCYHVLPPYDPRPPREAYLKAKELSIKALELDGTLAEAHASLAMSLENCDWDWKGAERELQRAIELNPNYATAHQWYGMHLFRFSGRFEEGIKELRIAAELDPLSSIIGANLAGAYCWANRLDEAIVQCKKVLDMEPNFRPALEMLVQAYRQKSMYREAIDESEKWVKLEPEELYAKVNLGYTYGVAGMQEEAKKIVGEVLESSRKRYVSPGILIMLYFSIGDMDKMYEWMQRSYDQHGMMVPVLRWDSENGGGNPKVWADPRFRDFMRKVGLE
jgi:adenylate cyclase